jgi:hypothetical protein
MSETANAAVSRVRVSPGLARVLFLISAMAVWAEANDRLDARYHLGPVVLILLRTVVDWGAVVWLGCVVWGKASHLDDLAHVSRTFLSVGLWMKLFAGIVLALSTLRTRSLLPGAVAHTLLWAIMCDN